MGADLGRRPGEGPGGCVFEERVGVGLRNALKSVQGGLVYKQVCVFVCLSVHRKNQRLLEYKKN